MQKVCIDELENIRTLLDYHMEDEAAVKLHAFRSCAQRSDCNYWETCARRLEDIWSSYRQRAEPRPA